MLRRTDLSIGLLAAVLAVAEPLTAQEIPAYAPHDVKVPDSATYLTRDGDVQIVGNDGWVEIINQFDELFLKTHPNFGRKFHLVLKGSSGAIPGIEMGVSAFAPMGRAMWEADSTAFKIYHGYTPYDIVVGYDAFGPRQGRKSPPGIYVNAQNPLAGLTVEQVRRVLTVGNAKGDLSTWDELGVGGKYAHRVIHVYGLDPVGGGNAWFRAEFLKNQPFVKTYEALPKPADVLHAVAEDPYGLALLGFADVGPVAKDVRPLPVARKEGDAFVLPGYDVVAADGYPFPSYMHIYLDREPGKPVDPFAKEYMRMILSREGQAILAAQKDTEEGYVPLAPKLIPEELKKLE